MLNLPQYGKEIDKAYSAYRERISEAADIFIRRLQEVTTELTEFTPDETTIKDNDPERIIKDNDAGRIIRRGSVHA